MTSLGILASQAAASMGDNAPPIPKTYNTAHPRLPAPNQGFLSGLVGNSQAISTYNATADGWDSTNPGNYTQLRRLVIAYMANKSANPSKAAGYFAKIKALADLGGTWGKLLFSANDGVGNGNFTVQSGSTNFLTACGGASCQNQILSIEARAFTIVSVIDAHTVQLSKNNNAPAGRGLKIRLFGNMTQAGLNIALIYDWLYNDLDPATRTEFMNELDVLCSEWEENYAGVKASPLNDVFYIDVGNFGLVGALAIYPDHPNGLQHLKFASDVWFNALLPAWSQVFGPEGGGWHEAWPDYVNAPAGTGMATFVVPTLLCWQNATGDPVFSERPWLKNFAYYTMYMTRPDFLLENSGDISRPYLTSEYNISNGSGLGSLNGLAEIYNDPVLRGWARLVNHENASGPSGFEPSAWPFYKPDNTNNPVSPRSALSTVHNFTGFGMLSMRTGWTEDDTSVSMKYGDNFWSHEHADVGAFTIFHRGNLAIDSGSYRAGYSSKHESQYARQAIAHNTLTITDPSDVYTTGFTTTDEFGNRIQVPLSNDGGQRRVGSPYNEHFPQLQSPFEMGMWMQNWDYFHMGQLVAFASTPNYTYAAVDMTAAYNNQFSATDPNATNRTNRVQKAVRHLIMIPRGNAAYVVVFDQVDSTNASFVKKWLLHSVNQPIISGNSFQISRDELVTPKPYSGAWLQIPNNPLKYTQGSGANAKYQYDGTLYGWTVEPQNAKITTVGGPGKEFWIEDPLNPGTGTNWNQCMPGQCQANTEGLGPVDNFVNPDPTTAPHEPGSWRIEVSPGTAETQDYFLHVMLATTTGDTNVPVRVTEPQNLPAGVAGATWTDGGHSYTVTLPRTGVGGSINISGVVNESLLAHSQPLPGELQAVSGDGQEATVGQPLASPFAVSVLDASGNPLANAAVHFAVTEGNGVLASETVFTNSQGQASVKFTPGQGDPGTQVQVMADVNGLRPVSFTATYGQGQGSGNPPSLSGISCTPTTVTSAGTSNCTVTLTTATLKKAAKVTIASNSALLTAPSQVSIPEGGSTATFAATAGTIATDASATLTATFQGTSKSVSITLSDGSSNNPPPPPVSLAAVTCYPTTIAPGGVSTCSVTTSGPASSGGAGLNISATDPNLAYSLSAMVQPKLSNAAFWVQLTSVSPSRSAKITVSYGSSSVSTTINLVASPKSQTSGQSGIPLVNGTWMMIPTQGAPVQSVGWENLVYAPPPVDKTMMLGDYHDLSSEPNEALISYDFTTNAWSVLNLGESFHSEDMPEGGHPVDALAYDPNQRSLIFYCCASGSNQPEMVYHMWQFDPIGQVGRAKPVTPKPGIPKLESAAFDVANDTYVLLGGGSGTGTWTYNPVTNSYVQQSPLGTNPPSSVGLPAMTYDSTDHMIYSFGGQQVGNSFTNALYRYDTVTNTWTLLNPSGPAPAPRWGASIAYDPQDNVFLLYGGQTWDQVYNDTWIYDPVANKYTQLNPPMAPPVGHIGPRQTLSYDTTHNVFVLITAGQGGYANGIWNGYSAQTWMFRYSGAGPNPGTATPNFQATPGSINKNVTAWAKNPSLASSGNSIYATWVETGTPYDNTTATWLHVYANKWTPTAGWTSLGSGAAALDSEWGNYSESHSPAITVLNGTPWVSWYKWNNAGQLWQLFAKGWNGSSWQGGAVGRMASVPVQGHQGRSQMTGIGGTPYIAFLEVDKTYSPERTFVYVKYWNGSEWVLKGSGPLNVNNTGATAGSVSIGNDGANPWVAWTEYSITNSGQDNETTSQVYVARWNGNAWQTTASLNFLPGNWADDVSLTFVGHQPYIAWTEHSAAGNSQVFVKTLLAGSWNLVGGAPLNKNASQGWAFRPSIAADPASGNVFVGWVEQEAMGQRAQTYVAEWSNGNWTALGFSLNANQSAGSAERVSLTIAGGQPVASWGEVNYGSMRQVYVKQWNGSNWVSR